MSDNVPQVLVAVQYLDDLCDKIKRLTDEVDAADGQLLEREDTIERLDRRIEELEHDLFNILSEDGHFITEADIDKVWEEIHQDVAWKHSERTLHDYYRDIVKTYFAKLGIVACETCGGSKRVEDEWEVNGPVMIDCPACHRNGKSHGWVWKVEVSDE